MSTSGDNLTTVCKHDAGRDAGLGLCLARFVPQWNRDWAPGPCLTCPVSRHLARESARASLFLTAVLLQSPEFFFCSNMNDCEWYEWRAHGSKQ